MPSFVPFQLLVLAQIQPPDLLATILQVVGLAGHQQWAAAVSLVLLWLWHATQDWSRFPVSLSPKWQAVGFVVIGAAYGVAQAAVGGMAIGAAMLHGLGTAVVSYGLVQLLTDAVFAGKPMPAWLAKLLLLFPAPLPPPTPPGEAPAKPARTRN